MKEYNFNCVYNSIYSTTIMAKNKEDALDLFLREFKGKYGGDTVICLPEKILGNEYNAVFDRFGVLQIRMNTTQRDEVYLNSIDTIHGGLEHRYVKDEWIKVFDIFHDAKCDIDLTIVGDASIFSLVYSHDTKSIRYHLDVDTPLQFIAEGSSLLSDVIIGDTNIRFNCKGIRTFNIPIKME